MRYKKILFALFVLFSFKTYCQDYKFIYYLDAGFNSTSKEKALIIGKGYKQEKGFILDCFSKVTGNKIASATFIDSSLSTLEGMFRSYYNDMKLESEGNYTDNEMDGSWRYWNNYGLITDSIWYTMGSKMAYATYQYYYNRMSLQQMIFADSIKFIGYLLRYNFIDSLKGIFIEKEYTVKGGKEILNFEVHFMGQRGLLKEYDSSGNVKADSVFERKYIEGGYPGGTNAWFTFLAKNLNANAAVERGAPVGKHTVIVKFTINPDGTLGEITAEVDPGYGLANDAIKVIEKSGKWIPSLKYGRYRREYRRQPVTYLVEE